MNEIGERIRIRREHLGISQDMLAKKLGFRSRSSIAKIEAGINNISPKKISQLAEILDISVSYLLGASEILPIESKKIPLLGDIACGEPIFAEEQFNGYIVAENNIHADFCLRAKGDSMIGARIYDGDIVFIRKQPDVLDGEIAAVLIDDEATLKRVFKMPNRLQLRAENPSFPPLNFAGDECKKIRILGKAVAFQSLVR